MPELQQLAGLGPEPALALDLEHRSAGALEGPLAPQGRPPKRKLAQLLQRPHCETAGPAGARPGRLHGGACAPAACAAAAGEVLPGAVT